MTTIESNFSKVQKNICDLVEILIDSILLIDTITLYFVFNQHVIIMRNLLVVGEHHFFTLSGAFVL